MFLENLVSYRTIPITPTGGAEQSNAVTKELQPTDNKYPLASPAKQIGDGLAEEIVES